MNKKGLRFQLSVFGDYTNIEPTSDNVKTLMDIFNGYQLLPTFFNEIIFDSIKGTQKQLNRLSFVSSDKSFNIAFASNRIDFIKQISDYNIGLEDINEYSKYVKKILFKIIDEYSSIDDFNRLSFITEYFIIDIEEEQKSKLYNKLTNNILFTDNIKEWSIKSVQKSIIPELENENINNICLLERIQGEIINDSIKKEIDEIKLLLDINTDAYNTKKRFNKQSITEFIKESLILHDKTLHNIENNLLND